MDIEILKNEIAALRTRLELMEQNQLEAVNIDSPEGQYFGMVPIGQVPTSATATGVFAIEMETDENDSVESVKIYNNYFSYGEVSTVIDDRDILDLIRTTPLVALKVPAAGQTEGPSIVGYSNFAALTAAQHNQLYVIRPLYLFTVSTQEVEGTTVTTVSIAIDFRNMPQLQMAEVL